MIRMINVISPVIRLLYILLFRSQPIEIIITP
jgi:hypothetical protein